MSVYDTCPACLKPDTRLRIAAHLMDEHRYPYPEALEWLKGRELIGFIEKT